MYGSNKVADNDSFRIRYAELKLTLDLNENLSASFMLDPAREAGSFPAFPSNQGSGISGESDVFYNAGFDMLNLGGSKLQPVPIGNVRNDLVRNGGGYTNKLLQDAYINFHGYAPHHDFTVGQFLRRLGEEGSRDDSQLDFIERAMITQIANVRDLGIQVHGSWWDQRAQYWIGGFDGAGTAFQSRYNRADDNSTKDLVATYAVRPVWNNEKWGNLELGQTILYGRSGEHGSSKLTGDALASDGLNRPATVHVMQYFWARYAPGSLMKGAWFEGEGLLYRDRFGPGDVASYLNTASEFPAPFSTSGWYASAGYKLSDSIWSEKLNNGGTLYRKVLAPLEFAFRCEDMGNLFIQSLWMPERRARVYSTRVLTGGVNYYLSGYNARLQLNYNLVAEQHQGISADFDRLQVREVRNNNLILSLQLAW
jgi:hypothetical protein